MKAKFSTPLMLLLGLAKFCSSFGASPITFMTVQDVTGDTVSGAFRFTAIDLSTYSGAVCFNSTGEIVTAVGSCTNSVIPGTGTDGGVIFGQFQAPTEITPGFIFAGSPFQPETLTNATATHSQPPQATIAYSATTQKYEMNVGSMSFGGLYNSQFTFVLPPDNPPAEACTASEQETNGVCVNLLQYNGADKFNYRIRWSHLITAAEDASGQFTGFNARFVLEGIATVNDAQAPVLTLNGSANACAVAGQPYNDAGASCIDDIDGNLSSSVVTTPANPNTIDTSTAGAQYSISYNCTDAASNSATPASRTVDVLNDCNDTTPPVITILGENPATVNVGDSYTDGGATCIDDVDGNISSSITTTPANPDGIDTSAAGTQTITYSCSDAAGNPASPVDRTVDVVTPAQPPVVVPFPAGETPSGCSLAVVPVAPWSRADWWVVAGFIAWLGAMVRRNRRSRVIR